MTLSSQASRAGGSRRYMSSSRRGPKLLLPLLVLLGIVGLVVVLWLAIFTGGDDATESVGSGAVASENGQGGDSSSQDSGSVTTSVSDTGDESETAGGSSTNGDQADESSTEGSTGATIASLDLSDISESRRGPSFGAGNANSDDTDAGSQANANGGASPVNTGSSASNDAPNNDAVSEGGDTTYQLPSTTEISERTGDAAAEQLRLGMRQIGDGNLVQGRATLSALLFSDQYRLAPRDAQSIRDTLASVNQRLVFSDQIVEGDPLAERYTVQSGDLLARIAPRYNVPYHFLEMINGINARNLRVGQRIKLIKGPLHAQVVKGDFRMDLYLRGPDGSPIYVRSYPVGLGENDSTPLGSWVVKAGSKVKNPDWRNPRTNEYYEADDPDNPIGEYWLALSGTDQNTRGRSGYGIHGTNQPESIGTMASMGCVRMHDDDIENIYEMLTAGESTVQVVP